MNSKIILTLLNIPRISRNIVRYIFTHTDSVPTTKNEIVDLFSDFHQRNKRIPIPCLDDISKAIEKSYSIIENSSKQNIGFVSMLDENFPESLRNIPDSPVLLHYKGNYNCLLNTNSVAIIGTRIPTNHGIGVAEKLGMTFGKDGFVVISGLAQGCDEFGHKGCIKSNGQTVAVMAGGLDSVYPSKNKDLAKLILDTNGCLISEYAIGVKPFRSSFVERDRLQSGLSVAVIVVETDIKGGTLHTVGDALLQNRILACYKHPDKYLNEKQSQGNQMLISEGKAIPLANEIDIQNLKNKILAGEYVKNDIKPVEKYDQIRFF
ncbi:MAG: DNA-processing protein DprA [Clostridium sp.]|uniref:DNA-processing protein DprA n=1 Tax=Clostridium sp. TaxID=1506 RepID=UPI003D6C8543